MCIPTKEVFYLFIPSKEHGKMKSKFLSYLPKMHWTAMSRFLIMQGVGHYNKNGLEKWFTIVFYTLVGYKINNFLETNNIYYKLQY